MIFVITFIGYTLQKLTRFSSLKIPRKVIRSRDTKDRHNGQKKERQTIIYKAFHRKLKIK
jgi:hypothetical protein